MAGVQRALVVALTGGIASGKSAVAQEFRRRGAPVNDADVVARDLVEPGSPALQEIARAFGSTALTPDGHLDRQAMRERVFANPDERRRLEAILHPRVHDALLAAARDCTAPYCVLVVPLLVEVHADYGFVDRVLVVDASPDVQLARLMQRDHSSVETAQRMLAAQAPRLQRLALADDVIDNNGDLVALVPPVERLHRLYLALSANSRA